MNKLCETSFEKKTSVSSVEKIKPFQRNNRIDNIDKNFHAVLNSDRRRLYIVEEKL